MRSSQQQYAELKIKIKKAINLMVLQSFRFGCFSRRRRRRSRTVHNACRIYLLDSARD